jgi:hypothetical protein
MSEFSGAMIRTTYAARENPPEGEARTEWLTLIWAIEQKCKDCGEASIFSDGVDITLFRGWNGELRDVEEYTEARVIGPLLDPITQHPHDGEGDGVRLYARTPRADRIFRLVAADRGIPLPPISPSPS